MYRTKKAINFGVSFFFFFPLKLFHPWVILLAHLKCIWRKSNAFLCPMRTTLMAVMEMLAVKMTRKRTYLFKSIIIKDFNFHVWQSWKKAQALGKVLQNIIHNSFPQTFQHLYDIYALYRSPASSFKLMFIMHWQAIRGGIPLNSTNTLSLYTGHHWDFQSWLLWAPGPPHRDPCSLSPQFY